MIFLIRLTNKIFLSVSRRHEDMDKNVLKAVVVDNQIEVPKYKIIPRDFTFEEFGNYVFVGIRRTDAFFLKT